MNDDLGVGQLSGCFRDCAEADDASGVLMCLYVAECMFTCLPRDSGKRLRIADGFYQLKVFLGKEPEL